MITIGKLSTLPEASVYRRESGDLYLKLNEQLHVKTKCGNDDYGKITWLGDGSVEQLDPNERVEVVQ